MVFHTEWRYWLLGFGWRTKRQRCVGYRLTLYFGPWRWLFGAFGETDGIDVH